MEKWQVLIKVVNLEIGSNTIKSRWEVPATGWEGAGAHTDFKRTPKNNLTLCTSKLDRKLKI